MINPNLVRLALFCDQEESFLEIIFDPRKEWVSVERNFARKLRRVFLCYTLSPVYCLGLFLLLLINYRQFIDRQRFFFSCRNSNGYFSYLKIPILLPTCKFVWILLPCTIGSSRQICTSSSAFNSCLLISKQIFLIFCPHSWFITAKNLTAYVLNGPSRASPDSKEKLHICPGLIPSHLTPHTFIFFAFFSPYIKELSLI